MFGNKQVKTIIRLFLLATFTTNTTNAVNQESSQVLDSKQTSLSTGEDISTNSINAHATYQSNNISQILLSTASAFIKDVHGKLHLCRVLLDNGSQANFITESLQRKLGLVTTKTNSIITGINDSLSNINLKTELNLQSRINSFNINLTCLVVPRITGNLPSISFDSSELHIPQNITLSDINFNVESEIDILVGASIFWQLLSIGQISLGKNNPILQKTKLGWVISGPLSLKIQQHNLVHCGISQTFDQQLEQFWDIKNINEERILSITEQQCENHFINTVKSDQTGRFIVQVPYKENKLELGDTRNMALKRFHNLEKRFVQNLELKREYSKFLHEYKALNHMIRIDETPTSNDILTAYLPHHAIFKSSSTTTKTRVVFDASAQSDSGLSLNDVQLVGPVVQNDLFTILLNFRRHTFVLTADIEKMYRQILVSNDDKKLQRIFWRDDIDEEIQCYELQTITYGTASAPYLATRCLLYLAMEYQSRYPDACDSIRNDFYVDDLLTGAESIPKLLQLKSEISLILDSANLPLRKWLSNESTICDNVTNKQSDLLFYEGESKTLGVLWNSNSDSFTYIVDIARDQNHVTKRTILSCTAQIFDPLGLLTPVTIVAKLIIQSLWKYRLSWDESVPVDMFTQWNKFRNNIESLNNLEIPRHTLTPNSDSIQIHGFADASERAFGACIYFRSINSLDNSCVVRLVCAKSRVAPLRQISLPRLELCAAVLLTNLMHKVEQATKINFQSRFFWTDSKIVLAWINSPSSRWQTFVANRVATIQRNSQPSTWFHVKSGDNPADLTTRGINPSQLLNSQLWWHGPHWLSKDLTTLNLEQTQIENQIDITLEARKTTISLAFVTEQETNSLFFKFSSLTKLIRVHAWMLRFINNTRSKNKCNSQFLSIDELEQSLLRLLKLAQSQYFKSEISNLKDHKQINSKSSLLALNPFLDHMHLLRVGGRLKFSTFTFDKKHPILLPKKHILTTLIIKHEHIKNHHCGAQALLAIIRERYWPISGRNLIKQIIRNCVICFKVNPKPETYIMGNLPTARLAVTPIFYNTGVDYAGPILLKDKRTRGNKTVKAYICLFVCMATKAVHLELVGGLTTELFISCLRRFIARRGKPKTLYSDNATNFVGAYSQIKEFHNFLNNTSVQEQIINFLANDGISWEFIPPRSPHFGGIWEAGIKSAKSHLKRIVGNTSLVFEDLNTVLVQIEAILNSRPLCPISSDPNDLLPLTPGHFIIGRPLTSIPEENLQTTNVNRLSHFQRLQQLAQHFWTRWSKEYVTELQTRTKWRQNQATLLKEGSLVIVREDNQPPLKWQLGRIIRLIPGSDNVTRVAEIQTSSSVIKRSVNKLCVLPQAEVK